MNSDSNLLYDKYLKKNNSSFLTAENTSIINSNIKNSFDKSKSKNNLTLKNITDLKYSNATLFTRPHKRIISWIKYSSMLSSPNTSKDKENNKESKDNNFQSLYLTESKKSYKSQSKNKYINYYRNKKKDLPKLKCYSHRNSEIFPELFTCGDFHLKPKLLAKLYYRQNKKKDKKENNTTNTNITKKIDINNNVLKEKKKSNKFTTREYLYSVNKMNYLNYCIRLKKEALNQYKKNMKSQIEGINDTINKIQDFKTNFENNYYIKYDEDKREFEKEIKKGKYILDILKKNILDLIKEVGHMSQIIIKKEALKKNYNKWLLFQIFLKEGKEPNCKNIKEYVDKKYGKKSIFENINDFFMILKEKEQINVRLITKSEKIIQENKALKNELEDLKSQLIKNNLKASIKIKEKESVLNIEKQRNEKLNQIKNSITSGETDKKLKTSKSSKNYSISLAFNKYRDIDIEKDLKLNKLGIFAYDLDKVKNINKMIYCIYNAILKNKLKGLDISSDTIYKIDNTLSNIKKALYQINIIEYSLNYLKSSINEKIKEKKNIKIINETKEQIELYHKTIKAKMYEEERKKKHIEFLYKMNEKIKKVYFIPNKKYDQYPFYLYNKKKNDSNNRIENKKLDLFDFLYDEKNS